MGVKIRVKANHYYLDIYHNGHRIWESLGMKVSTDPATAREQRHLLEVTRAKREMQLVSGQWGLLDKTTAKMTLYQYMKNLWEKKGKKKDRMKRTLPYLEKFPGGKTIQISQVTAKWISSFQDFLKKDTDLSDLSANSYSYAVRVTLRQAVRENIIIEDPSVGINNISVTSEPDREYLELEELKKLFKEGTNSKRGEEVKRAFLFACYCALRISDLETLEWNDIRKTTTGMKIIKRQIKTKKRVAVPLHDTAWKLIDDGREHHPQDPVFPLLSNTQTNTNKYLTRWVKKAGIPKHITWHAARRTCPTLLHELGVDIYTIQKICDHANIATTAKYVKVSDNKLREAVNTLPAMEV